MAGLKDISSVWKNIKEIDLKPIRDSATSPVRIVLAGQQGSGRHTLAEQMRTDPARPGIHTQSAIAFLPVEPSAEAPLADLIIIIVDATSQDFSVEQSLAKIWRDAGKNVLVLVNKIDMVESNLVIDPQFGWQASSVLYGSVNDIIFLQHEFIPVVLEFLPQQQIALGRQFPLFRLPVARQMINETCFSNATYSFTTGLAEIVPVLDIPLNVTDMIVLTKTQAFLAYKLGLLLGFSTKWQDYVTEFGSVIGSGFLWRQIARQLVGLIPAWGIIPKVAVAYSGTYVVGNAILNWYLTGKHLTPKQMRALSMQAFAKGKEVARRLGGKFPKARLGKRRKVKALDAPIKPELEQGDVIIHAQDGSTQVISPIEMGAGLTATPGNGDPVIRTISHNPGKRRGLLSLRKKPKNVEMVNTRTCPNCGKTSYADASFCQYCGSQFTD